MSPQHLDAKLLNELREAGGSDFAASLFEQIATDFARLHDALLAEIGGLSAHPDRDLSQVRRLSHELKGLALTVGATALSEACAGIEALAQQKAHGPLLADLPGIVGLCDQVRIELQRCIAGVA
jgi:HPt (histidine-containing phosphotransfer) domain-containing protein